MPTTGLPWSDGSQTGSAWWRDAVIYQIYPRVVPGLGRGRDRRPARRPRPPRPPGTARRRRAVALPDLPVPDGGLRLRRGRLHRDRPGLRHARRVRRARGLGARPRPPRADGPGARATRRSSTRGSASARTSTSGATGGRAAEQLDRDLRRPGVDPRPEQRGAWYLHSFFPEQPDLDWRNPEVVGGDAGGRALLAGPRRRRLPARRDRPPAQGPASCATTRRRTTPSRCRSARSTARSTTSTPRTRPTSAARSARCARRRATSSSSARSSCRPAPTGPTWSTSTRRSLRAVSATSTRPLCAARSTSALARRGRGVAWVLSNHDFPRLAYPARRRERHALAALLLLTLPGPAFVYQGDELGLRRRPGPRTRRWTAPAATAPATRCRGTRHDRHAVASRRRAPRGADATLDALPHRLIALRRELDGPLRFRDDAADGRPGLRARRPPRGAQPDRAVAAGA